MEYTLEELLDRNEMMSHMFLSCMPHDELMQIKDKQGDLSNDEFDINIEMKVDGFSVNPKEFFSKFEREFDRHVEGKAREIVREKLSGAMDDLAGKINEMTSVVGEWETEINWDVKNPLT